MLLGSAAPSNMKWHERYCEKCATRYVCYHFFPREIIPAHACLKS